VCIALCTIVAHNISQNTPDNFPSYPTDNHHCSDDVYLREGGASESKRFMAISNSHEAFRLASTNSPHDLAGKDVLAF